MSVLRGAYLRGVSVALALLLVVACALLASLAFAAAAQAAKGVVGNFGTTGTGGGQLSNPWGIAVNQTGAEGRQPAMSTSSTRGNNRV